MLVIVSDLHLTDGTSGTTIDADAFNIFRERLTDLAWAASTRRVNGEETYQPVKEIHLLLLGDILDVIRSTKWLQSEVRPWDDPKSNVFLDKVREITKAIIVNNQQARGVFQSLKNPGAEVPANRARIGTNLRVPVSIYYMAGNHDWFYHLPGKGFDQIRCELIETLGLANDPTEVFPHDLKESCAIRKVCAEHHVFARHGDVFDKNNYEPPNRDHSSLGDAVVIELVDRFPYVVEQRLGEKAAEGLKEIDNVRPADLIPKWVDGLLRRNPNSEEAKQVREIWNEVASDFLRVEFVRNHNSSLKWGLKLSEGMSFRNLGKIVPLGKNLLTSFGNVFPLFNKLLSRWGLSDGYYPYALGEPAFKDQNIHYIVYGHTHRQEIVPLRAGTLAAAAQQDVYLNSGTWRAVYDLARSRPKDEEFFGYHVMTYLAFFKGDERKGKAFETWSGSLESPMKASGVQLGAALPAKARAAQKVA